MLLIYYAGFVLWTGARLLPLQSVTAPERADPVVPEAGGAPSAVGGAGRGTVGGAATGVVTEAATGIRGDRPELALACRLSMGIAMLAMLLTL